MLVGPAKVSTARLAQLPNVHLLGRVERSAVPELLRGCSASLVPFHKTKLTARIVPLKIFEALAAGIMPVCTDFSLDLVALEHEGHARVTRTPDEFTAAIAAAVREDSPGHRAALEQFGRQQTWQARWTEMRNIVESQLSKRAAGSTSRTNINTPGMSRATGGM